MKEAENMKGETAIITRTVKDQVAWKNIILLLTQDLMPILPGMDQAYMNKVCISLSSFILLSSLLKTLMA
jgi:hypothetical protein